jgi:UDP-3-O-[3-hydroxymyristoyl] glucosamine N-acyltransferase
VEGDGRQEITSADALERATASQVSFVSNQRVAGSADASKAGCLIVPRTFENSKSRAIVRVDNPRAAFARVITALHPETKPAPGIHPSAVIALSAEIAPGCVIGPNVTIGERVTVGLNSCIKAGCVLEEEVALGDSCILHANVTLYRGVRLGNRVAVHSGCVIGADGFGFAFSEDHYEKFPQIGTVEIGDDVELGANTCVDRAAFGVTRIGKGSKLDNMVHVAHNCRIGDHVVIAAQTGFSGGVTIGDYAVIGGQVGVGDKASILSKAVVGSGSGILTSKVVRAGEPVWGTPARPLKQHLQQLAAVSRLPAALEDLKGLEKRVEELERR